MMPLIHATATTKTAAKTRPRSDSFTETSATIGMAKPKLITPSTTIATKYVIPDVTSWYPSHSLPVEISEASRCFFVNTGSPRRSAAMSLRYAFVSAMSCPSTNRNVRMGSEAHMPVTTSSMSEKSLMPMARHVHHRATEDQRSSSVNLRACCAAMSVHTPATKSVPMKFIRNRAVNAILCSGIALECQSSVPSSLSSMSFAEARACISRLAPSRQSAISVATSRFTKTAS